MEGDDHHHEELDEYPPFESPEIKNWRSTPELQEKLRRHLRNGGSLYLPAYAAYLDRQARELQEAAAAEAQKQARGLRGRFEDWFDSLPPDSRKCRYTMSEFETALGVPGRLISPVLLELGWRRARRTWSGRGQYQRYWEPAPKAD